MVQNQLVLDHKSKPKSQKKKQKKKTKNVWTCDPPLTIIAVHSIELFHKVSKGESFSMVEV